MHQEGAPRYAGLSRFTGSPRKMLKQPMLILLVLHLEVLLDTFPSCSVGSMLILLGLYVPSIYAHALIQCYGKIWSYGFLIIRSSGFGQMDQLVCMHSPSQSNVKLSNFGTLEKSFMHSPFGSRTQPVLGPMDFFSLL